MQTTATPIPAETACALDALRFAGISAFRDAHGNIVAFAACHWQRLTVDQAITLALVGDE